MKDVGASRDDLEEDVTAEGGKEVDMEATTSRKKRRAGRKRRQAQEDIRTCPRRNDTASGQCRENPETSTKKSHRIASMEE